MVMAHDTEQVASESTDGGIQAGPIPSTDGHAYVPPTDESIRAALEDAATCEDPFKTKETYARLDEQMKVAEAMPIEELSDFVRTKAQMAVENNWMVDAPVRILSEQGLEAGYRAFLGTLPTPPEMGAEEYSTRMHRFGLTLLYVIRQQEAFGFKYACCNDAMDRSVEERKWVFGTMEEEDP